MAGLSGQQVPVLLPAVSTPTQGPAIYTKSDGNIYFLDASGVETLVVNTGTAENYSRDYHFSSPSGSSGTFYAGGWYDAPAADANLTQAGATQTLGTANGAYGAHAFAVCAAVGTSDKSAGAVELEVSGTSITDAGVRTTSDTEVIIADIEGASVVQDAYFETTKKWIGQVTYTLKNNGSGNASTFALDFNYGLAKYEDFGNRDFTIRSLEMTGRAGANDSGFGVTLYHHDTAGWTYSAAAFVPGGTVISTLASVYVTEDQLVNGDPFAAKLTGLSEAIEGSGMEGVVFKITTGANNAVDQMNIHLGVSV